MRSIVVFALFASALAVSCTGRISDVPFDLTPLTNNMEDYRTVLDSPDPSLNRTYILFCIL